MLSAKEVICHCLPSITRASSYTHPLFLISPYLHLSLSFHLFIPLSISLNPPFTLQLCCLSATLAKCSFLFVLKQPLSIFIQSHCSYCSWVEQCPSLSLLLLSYMHTTIELTSPPPHPTSSCGQEACEYDAVHLVTNDGVYSVHVSWYSEIITKYWYPDTRYQISWYRENITISNENASLTEFTQCRSTGHHWGAASSLMSHTTRGLHATLLSCHSVAHYYHATLLSCHSVAHYYPTTLLWCYIATLLWGHTATYELWYHTARGLWCYTSMISLHYSLPTHWCRAT